MTKIEAQASGSSFAEAYWDFIDVNANLERAEWVARRINNGFHSGVNFVVMLVLFLFSLALAWHFDFHSTYDALDDLRQQLIPSLPVWAAGSAAIITGIITVAPTLMEIFTSNLARANILVIKMLVLGFSAFDVITDIPTTKAWITTWQSSFDALGPVIGWIAYWIAFFGWLLMATVGFQLTVAIFGYLIVIFFKKMTVGMSINTSMPQSKAPASQPKVAPKPVTIINAEKATD